MNNKWETIGKLTLQLAWLAGLELVTIPGTTDLLKLETGQHSNLDFNVTV